MTTDVDRAVHDTTPSREDRPARWASRTFWLCVVGLALAGVAAVWVHRDWLPTTDLAWQQLLLQGIPGEWPVLGAYSRWGWSHPGPFFHYWLWVPWRLLGGASAAMLLAMLVLHLVAVALAWLTARARSVALGVLVAAGLLLVWAAVGAGQTVLPWNPMVGLLLGGTFVVAVGDAATRGRWGSALLLPIGTVLVQAHIGTAVLVTAGIIVAGVLGGWRRGQDRPVPLKPLAWSMGVTALLWLAPAIEAFPDGGNLRAIVTTETGTGLGWGQALWAFADAWSVPAYWWTGEPWLPDGPSVPFLLLVPITALVVAVIRRDAAAVRWLTAGCCCVVTAVPSVARADQGSTYLVSWVPAVVAMLLAISVWVLLRASRVGEAWVIRLAPLLIVVPAVLVGFRLVGHAPLAFDHAPVAAAVRAGQQSGGSGVHVSVSSDDPSKAFEVVPAVVTGLRSHGIPVTGDVPDPLPAGLNGLIGTRQEDRRGLLIDFPTAPESQVPAGWEVVADEDPFTAQEWRELSRYRSQSVDPRLSERDRALALLGYEQTRAGRTAWRVLLEGPTDPPRTTPGGAGAPR